MVAPIDYTAQVADPFKQAAQGFQLGAGLQQFEEQRQLLEKQKIQQQIAAQEEAKFFANPNPTMRDALRFASVLPKDRADALRPYIEAFSKEQQQGVLKTNGQILSALQVNPQTGVKLLRDYATAQRNSGDEAEASLYERIADAAEDPNRGPALAFKSLVTVTSRIPGAKEMFESIDKSIKTQQEEALFPDLQKQKEAEMRKAVSDADKAAVEAKYAEKVAIADLQKKAADLGLTKAQTNKALVETNKLGTEAQMLRLDFDAALKGLPLPSKGEGGKAATEDERKAAGWLAQATNAYTNMLGAMYTKEGKPTGAEKPGVVESALGTLPFIGEGTAAIARSTDRQKFNQAASSLSEALLRAATGAGVNRDEAKQKLEELTPLFSDDEDTRKQKLAAIPVYLDSLRARAGRAAPKDYQVPTAPGAALSFTLPDGRVVTFQSQQALDGFKKAAGL